MEGRYEFILLENGGLSKRLFGANQVSLRMFAIIEDGSHQYRVALGETLVVDYRDGSNVGDSLNFERVLLANGGGSSTIGPASDPCIMIRIHGYHAGLLPLFERVRCDRSPPCKTTCQRAQRFV